MDLKLSFRAPISLSEDLPLLESDGASNDAFMLHRSWLVSTLDKLDAIKDFRNKEIVGRHAGLAKWIERDISTLLMCERNQWHLAKVRANLHGLSIGNDETGPPTIRAGALVHISIWYATLTYFATSEQFYAHQRLPQELFLLAALFLL